MCWASGRLHGLCGAGAALPQVYLVKQNLGGLGGVSLLTQILGTCLGIIIALVGAFIVYGLLNKLTGLRLSQEDEFNGADLAIHKISSTNEE